MLKLKLPLSSLKRGLGIGLPILVIFGYFSYQEMELIQSYPIDAWERDLNADCAVVLTGGAGRVKEGLDLLVRGQVKRVIIAGVHPQVTLRDLYPQLVLYPALDENNFILERRSETTYGNAQQALPIVEALQCKHILLVTSYLHMRRALKTFEAAFPATLGIRPYAVAGSDYPPRFWDLFVETSKIWFYSIWAY